MSLKLFCTLHLLILYIISFDLEKDNCDVIVFIFIFLRSTTGGVIRLRL